MHYTLFFLSVFLDVASPQLSFLGEGVIQPYQTLLAPDKLPTLSLTAGTDDADVAYVYGRPVPVTFQYRVTKSLAQSKYPPWLDDLKAKAISREGATTCATLLSQQSIRVRGPTGETLDVPLRPIPLEQEWDKNLIKTDQPGIERNRLSTCCDEEKCLDRCLLLPKGEPAFLEINAPSYGKVEVVTSNIVNQGGARGYGNSGQIVMKYDPGLWPVMRIPCLHCPIKSCITNCSNGEYSTGYTDYSVSHAYVFDATGSADRLADRDPGETCGMQALRPRHLEYVQDAAKLSVGDSRWAVGYQHGDGYPQAAWRSRCVILAGAWKRDTLINLFPVGACYPCSRIRESFIYKEHYKGYAQQTSLEFSMAFRCPGTRYTLFISWKAF